MDEMTTDTPEVPVGAPTDVVDTPAEKMPDASPSPNTAKMWLGRIQRTKKVRKELIKSWSDNVDYRRGKPFDEYSDEDRVNVNLDWSFTKGKHAQLYSQTPQVYLTPKDKQFASAVPVFGKVLNDTLQSANVGAAIDEATLDTINASGWGIVHVNYQALDEDTVVPEIPADKVTPEMQATIDAGTYKIPMVPSKRITSRKFSTRRVSPSDGLWPTEFTGSDFDDADWVGHSGRMLWSEAVRSLKVKETDREAVLGKRGKDENLRSDSTEENGEEPIVEYDEIFYWAYRFDAQEKYHKKINHIVFVEGLKEPVYHGAWAGQKFDEATGRYVGSCKFPLRFLTLTYVSDDAIPPSDSAIGRPQVDEMIESRTQIVKNRQRSQPIRWANSDRVDPMVMDTIMRGEYQPFIPIQGDGQRAIGEVARAAYPTEDWAFDNAIKADLQEQWQLGPNQTGSFGQGRRSAAETNTVQQNFQTRVGYERGKVGLLLTGIAEVMGGLLALYGDFEMGGPEDVQRLSGWDRTHIGNEFVYWIRPDSTVLLDANQRIDRLMKVLNMIAQSGYVNVKPIIAEIIELHGLDPADIMIDPQPKPAPEPNVSYRFSGVEDLTNPLVIAFLVKSGQAPSPQDLEAAKKILEAVNAPPMPPPPPLMPGGPPGAMPGPPAPPEGGPTTLPRPDWGLAPKVAKRQEDI